MVSAKDLELAQVSVIGSLLLEPSLTGEVLLRLPDGDFLSDVCRTVYQAIRALFQAGETIDPVTVRQKLGGGTEWNTFLLQAMELTPTTAHVREYIRAVREEARLSRLRSLGLELAGAVDLEDARGILDKATGQLVERSGVRFVTMEQALLDFYERHREEHKYFTWPLPKLNGGLYVEGGDLVVLGGYSSAGKTALALMFAWHLAESGKRVGFFSLETGERKLHDRLIAYTMCMNFAKIKRSQLEQEDYEALSRAAPKLTAPPLEFVDASGMTAADIRAFALSRRYEAIFIDYLQLIQGGRRDRYNIVTDTSIALHQMSQSTGIAVFALSQLNRAEKVQGREKAPTMSSLRESGQIEQDADVVLLLYKEDSEDPESPRKLRIAKNKEGEQGYIRLAFEGSTQTFRELPDEDQSATLPPPVKRPRQYHQVSFADRFWQDLEGPPPEGDPFAEGDGEP